MHDRLVNNRENETLRETYGSDLPDATVIVAAWCAEDVLERSVLSALAQEEVTVEVIIVDDASPDGTGGLARRLADSYPAVHCFSLARNGGPSAARNAALDQAQGEWVAVLDADDTMTSDRLAGMIAAGRKASADVICDDFLPTDPEGQPLGNSHLSHLRESCGEDPSIWDLEVYLAGCQAIPGVPAFGYLKPVFRRAFLLQQALRYDEQLRNGEDFHIIAELLAVGGRYLYVPRPGYFYTIRQGSVSRRLNPDHAYALMAADRNFALRNDPILSLEAKALLASRMANLRRMTVHETVMQSLKSGSYVNAARVLAAQPACIPGLTADIWSIAARRLGGGL